MTEEFYIVALSWSYGDTYLKNLYSWTFSGYQQPYITHDQNILKAKHYKTLQGVKRVVNRLESYYNSYDKNEKLPDNIPKVKALKIEIEIKTIEV